jgi:hypothetical protein
MIISNLRGASASVDICVLLKFKFKAWLLNIGTYEITALIDQFINRT